MDPIVGIDLGTTTSAIAFMRDNHPVIIPHQVGGFSKNLILSLVGIINNEIHVGDECRGLAESYPLDIVREVKRKMGEDCHIKIGSQELRPQEIAAHILRRLKKDAEEYLGCAVKEAVISVPAHFSPNAKHATIEAGQLAGFNVERLIFEPTAAALAYGMMNREKREHVMVFDLGGGTFDVSVLENYDGVLEVKATGGDQKLGGKDFDEKLANYVMQDIKANFEIDWTSKKDDPNQELRRLCWLWTIRNRCEEAKINLSVHKASEIRIPFIGIDKTGAPLEYRKTIEREQFEEMIRPDIERTIELTQRTLREAKIKVEDVNKCLLVGGSTKIPMVTRLLSEKLGINPKRELPQDEAVVLGAAVQAGIKSGVVSPEQGIILQDICPHSLGVAVTEWTGHQMMPDVFDVLIKKGTVIPYDEAKEYSTLRDNQTGILVRIYAGEGKHVSQNTLIGKFSLEGIPQAEAGEEKINIHFSYDINGNLKVRAKILSTGVEKGEDILLRPGQLSREELESGKENIEHLWEKHPEISEVKAMIKKAEEKISVLEGTQKEHLKKMVGDIKRALLSGNLDLVKDINDKLTDFLFELE